jgi:choline kinase
LRIQRAVILAAGRGSRMGAFTARIPKPLLMVGGRTLIDRQIEALKRCGVRHVAVVAGYREQRLRRHLGRRATIVSNERYRETNGLYSLWLAAQHLVGGAFVLDGDLLLTPLLLEHLKWHPAPDALLFHRRPTLGSGEVKVRLAGPYVVDVSREMSPTLAAGEHVGLLKFGPDGASRLTEVLHALVAAGEVNARTTRAVVELAHRWPIVGVDAEGFPWTQVDCPEDLHYASRMVAPRIDASMQPPVVDRSLRGELLQRPVRVRETG